MTEPRIEEKYFDKFYRVIKIDLGNRVFYSIDYYVKLDERPECSLEISLEGTSICYFNLGRYCIAVVIATSEGYELVNLRLDTLKDKDPAKGDLTTARDICIKEVGAWLEGRRHSINSG